MFKQFQQWPRSKNQTNNWKTCESSLLEANSGKLVVSLAALNRELHSTGATIQFHMLECCKNSISLSEIGVCVKLCSFINKWKVLQNGWGICFWWVTKKCKLKTRLLLASVQAYKGSVCVCKENLCFVTLYGLLEKAGPQMQSLFSSEHKDGQY